MKTLKAFFQRKETYLGIAVAIAFQVIFFSVWLTAYDGVTERTSELKIGVVNEDETYGKMITQLMEQNAPFTVSTIENLETAKKELDEREWHMIVHIPEAFSIDVQSGEAELSYLINQSNPTLSKQIMETAASSITHELNLNIYQLSQQEIAQNVPPVIAAETPNPEFAAQLAEKVIEVVQTKSHVESVKASIIKTNDVEGFAATMIPLMVVLASYIGAMIMSQQLQFATSTLKQHFDKWAIFFSRQIINIGVAIGLSVITLMIMLLFNIQLDSGLFVAWLFQSLLFFSFLSLTQLFVILFGNPGMIFNIALTATQLVSAGAIVPREMLSSFYKKLGDILPATYGTNGYFSLIYGGGHLNSDFMNLLLITGITLLIAGGVIFFSRGMKRV